MLEVVDSHIRSWNGDQGIPGLSESKPEKYSESFSLKIPKSGAWLAKAC